jgi:hypothetical protein
MNEQESRRDKPLIDKEATKNRKGPICPYCLSHIERLSFVPEKSAKPKYRYMFCQECNAFLSIIPVESDEMDVEFIESVIKG